MALILYYMTLFLSLFILNILRLRMSQRLLNNNFTFNLIRLLDYYIFDILDTHVYYILKIIHLKNIFIIKLHT